MPNIPITTAKNTKVRFLLHPFASSAVVFLLFSVACNSALLLREEFTLVFTSPETASRQGYTTDGIYHYTSDTATLYKRSDDQQWSVAAQNTQPFAGLFGRPNHLGDLDYHDGRLYVPVERFFFNCTAEDQQIAVYDAGSLLLLTSVEVSWQGAGLSGVAVVPGENLLYATLFCDGRKLLMYDLSSLSFAGSLNLSRAIPNLQGITWDETRFYVSSSADNRVYVIERDGSVRGPVLGRDGCEAEGLKWSDGTLRWSFNQARPGGNCAGSMDNFVYFYRPVSRPGQ
jgi:hypothetical protein